MRSRLLPRWLPLSLVRVGLHHPRLVLVGALVAWVVAGLLTARVRIETDILSLVPEHNRVVSDFKTTIDRFGSVDTLLVVLRIDPEQETEAVVEYANQLARSLREWESIDWVEYRLENPTTALAPLLDRATLFLKPDELEALLASLDQEALDEQAMTLRDRFMTPQSLVMKDLLRLDPAGLLQRLLGRVRIGEVGARFDPETGCLIDRERRFLLMLARPVRPAQDIAFDAELVDGLPARVAMATDAWHDAGWDGEPPVVDFTGGYIISLEDSKLIVSDLLLGAIGSLVGVMALFLFAFRRRAALGYALLPLVTGLGLTLAFGAVVLGRLNSATSAFAALLIGLGIDFIIVLYGRYIEERQAGAGHEAAIEAMASHTGVGVLLGAVTTAATFYAFLVTDFRGLSELGLLTGTGILLLMMTVFLLLPALLTLVQERRHGPTKRLYIHSFGSGALCRASLARPRLTLVVVGVVTAAMAVAMLELRFDDDIRNMRSADNRGILLQQEVMDAFGLRFTPMMVRVDAPTEPEAMAHALQLLPRLEPLVDGENLARIDTVAGVIPAVEDQRKIIERLEAAAIDGEALAARLEQALRSAGLNPVAFKPGIEALVHALKVERPLELEDLVGTPFEHVLGRYIAHFDSGVSTVIYCYPPAGRWRREAPPALQAVVDQDPAAVLAGPNVVSAELRHIVWGDAARAAILGLVLVYALLWADLGGPLRGLLALMPLVAGMVWMLGTMALLGLYINFMNVFVITMVIGIGVDYGVHLLHRWHESGGQEEAVCETAKAITVAALTTMVGFGSLVLSHYPGLRSVGAAAILGALFSAVLGITLLPAVLKVLTSRVTSGD